MPNRNNMFNNEEKKSAQERLKNHHDLRKYLLVYCVISFYKILSDPFNKAVQANNFLLMAIALMYKIKEYQLSQEARAELYQSHFRR